MPNHTPPTLARATFLSRRQYFLDLIEHIGHTKPGDRVLLVTHDLEPHDPLIKSLLDVIAAAARRGVDIQFAVDERIYPVMQRIPITRASQARITTADTALQKLADAGVTYRVTNKSYYRVINRFARRSHGKVAVINDMVYMGGCNLGDSGQIDFMIRWHDPKAADWLCARMNELIRTGNSRAAYADTDMHYSLDTKTTILLDAGKPRQSLIFDHALRLIDSAESWIVLTCQFFPNSVTGQHLAQAYKRGVNVSIYYNHPSLHRPGMNILLHLTVLHERTRKPAALFSRQLNKNLPFMHAKLLATDKGAILGSHNYVANGVNFGTSELSIECLDPGFAAQARDFFERLVADASSERLL